jgi:uncharacterized protein (UPF0303 family)
MSDQETISALKSENDELQFPLFNAEIAWRIGSLLQKRAAEGRLAIAIEVSMCGQQLFYCAMPGATPDNAAWIRRKRAVVERFHRSSLFMKVSADEQGRPMLERYALSPEDYASSGGAVPIIVKGTGCVGAVV